MIILGDFSDLPVSINVQPDEKMEDIIIKVLKTHNNSENESYLRLKESIELSTLSANIPISPKNLTQDAQYISEKFGNSFLIKKIKQKLKERRIGKGKWI